MNRKKLPREKKMEERILQLEEDLLAANESIRELKRILNSQQIENKHIRSFNRQLQNEIADLEDFKKITRLALPHLQAIPLQMMAMNSSNDDRQEH